MSRFFVATSLLLVLIVSSCLAKKHKGIQRGIRKEWRLLGPKDQYWNGGSQLKNSSTFIAGGKDAEPNILPGMVSLQLLYNGQVYHICGGTLASRNKVLTAAHCLDEVDDYPHQVAVGYHVLSEGTANPNSQVIAVKSAELHQGYDGNLYTGLLHDIAMLTLSENANLVKGFVELQTLDTEPVPYRLAGTKAFLVGWGLLSTDGKISNVLQYLDYKVLSKKECRRWWKVNRDYFPETHLCVVSNIGGDCNGDSGGPMLTMSKVQIGITSWGPADCGPHVPSIYTNIGSYYNWIQERL